MIQSQAMTDKLEVNNSGLTAAATSATIIDRLGADYATIRVAVSNIAQATIASADGTTIKLEESDDTNSSNFATIVANRTGIKFGREVRYEVDCRGRKRYLRLSVVPGTSGATNDAVTATVFSTMSRKENGPASTQAMTGASNDAVVFI